MLLVQEDTGARVSRHARRYTIYQRLTESTDCNPHKLQRHTITRARWIRVGARAFPLEEAREYYHAMLTQHTDLALRPVPKEA